MTERMRPSSMISSPAMVLPAGVVTWSFSAAGCIPVCSTMRAAPWNICAAICIAVSRRSPMRTPPSESASSMMYAKAGPLPLRLVTASIALSSASRQPPTLLKISMAISAWSSVTPGPRAITVIPSPIRQGVLGMARTTALLGSQPAS